MNETSHTQCANEPAVCIHGLNKSFVLHLRGGVRLPAVTELTFNVYPGECIALDGPSGAGKSSVLRMIYGNYLTDSGQILVRSDDKYIDVAAAAPREVVGLRRTTIGYVSQFLRVIPRVPCLEIVAGAARMDGLNNIESLDRAQSMLTRLNVPERLWDIPPATFSGGEKQRVNIARGFAGRRKIMLLDEPTASLDLANTETVIALIAECKAQGAAIIGVFHDRAVRDQVADRTIRIGAQENKTA